jgi:MFS family permease
MSTTTDSGRRRWAALAVIVTAQFMVILDVAVVNVALPSIKTDLNFSDESLQWVVSAYAIFFGGALLLGGRLADLLGRRRLFVGGLVLFAASSLPCGLAWSEASLIGFRALQGLSCAACACSAVAAHDHLRRGRERNLALGIYGAASGSVLPPASSSSVLTSCSAGRGSSSSTFRSVSLPRCSRSCCLLRAVRARASPPRRPWRRHGHHWVDAAGLRAVACDD